VEAQLRRGCLAELGNRALDNLKSESLGAIWAYVVTKWIRLDRPEDGHAQQTLQARPPLGDRHRGSLDRHGPGRARTRAPAPQSSVRGGRERCAISSKRYVKDGYGSPRNRVRRLQHMENPGHTFFADSAGGEIL
jgi:hypothetical protein